MARVTKVLTAINDVCGPISMPDQAMCQAGVFLGAGAVGTVVLEVSGMDDGAAQPADIWAPVPISVDGGVTFAANLAGAAGAQYAWGWVPGGTKVRIRKSVAGPGDARTTLGVPEE